MTRKAFEILRSLVILYLFLYLGGWIADYINIGIPASIWGLLLLFSALVLRVVKVEWVWFSASLLIRYMALLFVPVSVGIMDYFSVLVEQVKVLILPNIISSCLTLLLVGLLADYLFSLKSFSHLRHKLQKQRDQQN